MSTLTAPIPASSPPFRAQRARWTVDEFHKLVGLPVFEGRKMILVDGEILDMPAPNHPHDLCVAKTNRTFGKIFPDDIYWVRIQMSLPLGKNTDPIPDLAVIVGEMTTHQVHPTSALMVVEVSNTSLDYDTGDKADLYASAGIADYWVLDVNGRKLIVFRDPIADSTRASGHRYATIQTLDASATIAPLAAPQGTIRIADLALQP
ncbi:MAG: Uma2 family endonuclease [Planctomycetes bacterium]|nr:Uma2 family endonuclease [Planctomycetota bacterium]